MTEKCQTETWRINKHFLGPRAGGVFQSEGRKWEMPKKKRWKALNVSGSAGSMWEKRRRLWSRRGTFQFKTRNQASPEAWLGPCSQGMPLNKEMVSILRPGAGCSGWCQTALWNETNNYATLTFCAWLTSNKKKTCVVGWEEETRSKQQTFTPLGRTKDQYSISVLFPRVVKNTTGQWGNGAAELNE